MNAKVAGRRLGRMTLGNKIALFAALLVVATAGTSGLVLHEVAREAMLRQEQERLAYIVHNATIESRLTALRRNVQLLALSSGVRGLIAASPVDEGRGDPSRSRWEGWLALTFEGMLKAHPAYFRARYVAIGESDREIVVVERVGDAMVRLPVAAMGRPAGNAEHAVRIAAALPRHAVHLSSISLASGPAGGGDRPQPVLSAATPVHDDNGDLHGVIVLDVTIAPWLVEMAQGVPLDRTIHVTNEKGDRLGPIAVEETGLEAGHRQPDTDELAAIVAIHDVGAEDSLSLLTERTLFHARRLALNARDAHSYLVIVATSPRRVALAGAAAMRGWTIAITVTLILIGGLTAFLLTHHLSRPLAGLTHGAQRLAAGEPFDETGMPAGGSDEIGTLVEAFRVMAHAIKEREDCLRESDARTQAIIESAGSAILTVAENGTIESANSAAEAMFGCRRHELIGRNIATLLRSPDRERHPSYVEECDRAAGAECVGISREVTALRFDGTCFPAHLSIARVALAERTIYAEMLTDLTEVKKVERMKDEFVSTVSHELRTPLTSIKGALGLLKSGVTGRLPRKAQAMITIAHSNADQLVRLINDILDLEKIGSGKMPFSFQTVALAPLLSRAADANRALADQAGVRITLHETPAEVQVRADPDRLTQVLSNLLSNAVKFSPSDTEVVLSAACQDTRVRVSVADRGPGIPMEFRDKLFEKFAQADASSTRAKGGTGLGLSICKAIIEAHGGCIGFTPRAGGGTTFHFELPAAATTPAEVLLAARRETAAAVPLTG